MKRIAVKIFFMRVLLIPFAFCSFASQAEGLTDVEQSQSVRNEIQLQSLFGKLASLYADEFNFLGIDFNLILDRSEAGSSGDFSIRARRKGDPAHLMVHPTHTLSPEAVPSILCHEVGHVLVGYAKKVELNYSTVEPEADYFSATDCLRKLFSLDGKKNVEIAKSLDVPTVFKSLCHRESDNPSICIRIIDSVSNFFGYHLLANNILVFPIEEKNENIFYGGYPSDRCRFATVVAGALCQKTSTSLLDMLFDEGGEREFVNLPRNYCSNKLAKRPDCWFPLKLDYW